MQIKILYNTKNFYESAVITKIHHMPNRLKWFRVGIGPVWVYYSRFRVWFRTEPGFSGRVRVLEKTRPEPAREEHYLAILY